MPDNNPETHDVITKKYDEQARFIEHGPSTAPKPDPALGEAPPSPAWLSQHRALMGKDQAS
jgi:hypothetical protein